MCTVVFYLIVHWGDIYHQFWKYLWEIYTDIVQRSFSGTGMTVTVPVKKSRKSSIEQKNENCHVATSGDKVVTMATLMLQLWINSNCATPPENNKTRIRYINPQIIKTNMYWHIVNTVSYICLFYQRVRCETHMIVRDTMIIIPPANEVEGVGVGVGLCMWVWVMRVGYTGFTFPCVCPSVGPSTCPSVCL